MSLSSECAVVITTPAGKPISVAACIGSNRVATLAERLLKSQGHRCYRHPVGACGGSKFGPKAIVIQLLEGDDDGGMYAAGDIVCVAQNWPAARRWLAKWYAADGYAARPIAVDWHWPRFTAAESA